MLNHKIRTKYQGAKALEISGIFDRVAVDLQFGFPTSSEGHNGLLVMAYPMLSKQATEIAERLFEYGVKSFCKDKRHVG